MVPFCPSEQPTVIAVHTACLVVLVSLTKCVCVCDWVVRSGDLFVSGGTKSEVAHKGRIGYITPAVWGFHNASQWGTKSEVPNKWAHWLHNPCCLGGPLRFRAGGLNQQWPTIRHGQLFHVGTGSAPDCIHTGAAHTPTHTCPIPLGTAIDRSRDTGMALKRDTASHTRPPKRMSDVQWCEDVCIHTSEIFLFNAFATFSSP